VLKKVHKIYTKGALLLVVAVILFWWYVDRPDRYDVINDRPLGAITVDNISDYFNPSAEINALVPERLVEIEGQIKEINTLNGRHTVMLKGRKDKSPYIICDMQTGQEKELKLLKENDTIKIKGIFKGFLKDAIFLHCMITHHNINE